LTRSPYLFAASVGILSFVSDFLSRNLDRVSTRTFDFDSSFSLPVVSDSCPKRFLDAAAMLRRCGFDLGIF
jgi:hypothetical protein